MALPQVPDPISEARSKKANQIIGSAAAAIQSMIGPVKSGSVFSLLQSAAAGGSGFAVVNGMVATSAGVGIGAVAATCP
jgi:hypothetical protein